jgi:hypothetical protein
VNEILSSKIGLRRLLDRQHIVAEQLERLGAQMVDLTSTFKGCRRGRCDEPHEANPR